MSYTAREIDFITTIDEARKAYCMTKTQLDNNLGFPRQCWTQTVCRDLSRPHEFKRIATVAEYFRLGFYIEDIAVNITNVGTLIEHFRAKRKNSITILAEGAGMGLKAYKIIRNGGEKTYIRDIMKLCDTLGIRFELKPYPAWLGEEYFHTHYMENMNNVEIK
jgi:DNA-binding phage protein